MRAELSPRLDVGGWLDERLGSSTIYRALLARPMPGELGWAHTLGSATLFVFLVQVVTGVLLAMAYAPTPDHAYDSILFIEDGLAFGWLVRGLHHWGASAMVILVSLHLLRVFLQGAYKRPREVTWLSGTALLALTLGFGFTGYLLPWDQKAYWATTVGVTLVDTIPLVGGWLADAVRGGGELGAMTLNRFFAGHVLILPVLTLGLLAVHLFLVIYHGIARPPVPGPETRQPQKVPFYPDVLAKDALTALVVLFGLLTLTVMRGTPLESPADPTSATYNPRPEWYFLPFFQFLKAFPGRLEGVAVSVVPAAAALLVILVPFLDRSPERHPRRRPVTVGLGLTATASLVALGVAGARAAGQSTQPGDPGGGRRAAALRAAAL